MIKKSELTRRLLLLSITTTVSMFVIDITMGVLGFPDEPTPLQIAHPPNYHETRSSFHDFTYTFTTNSQGLRWREVPIEKRTKSEKRIFVTGDSFVEGYGVEIQNTFLSILEQNDQIDATFIDGALAGTGPLQQIRLLCLKGFQYHPDIVLFCIFANDVSDTPDTKDFIYNPLKKREKDGLAKVVHSLWPRIYTLTENAAKASRRKGNNRSKKRDFIAETTREARKRGFSEESIRTWQEKLPTELVEATNRHEFPGQSLSLALLNPDFRKDSLDIDTPSAQRRLNNMITIMNYGLNECQRRDIKVGLIYIPSQLQYNPKKHTDAYYEKKLGFHFRKEWLTETTALQHALDKWAAKNQLPFLDLTDTFRQAQKDNIGVLNYEYDVHWTPLGHRIAADRISQWLLDEHIIEKSASE